MRSTTLLCAAAVVMLSACGGGGGGGESGGPQAYAVAAAARQWLKGPATYDFRTGPYRQGMLLEVGYVSDIVLPALSQEPVARTLVTEFEDGGSRGPFPSWNRFYYYRWSPLQVLGSSLPGAPPDAASKVETIPEFAMIGSSGPVISSGAPGSVETVTWSLAAADAQSAWLCLHFERQVLAGTQVSHYCLKILPAGTISDVTGSH